MIKSPIFDSGLIRQFRDQFNFGNFGYLRYKDRNGKNDFSAICSAMDWIEVAVDYINELTLSKDRSNIMSMKVFSFIMAVDMIYSGITTMHRVILNTSAKETPFDECHDIFNLKKSDNKHFKELRAAFGAHPTDLYGETKKETRYASWSVSNFMGNDFSVIVYSSIPEKEREIYGFMINDLIQFAKIRYEYLKILLAELKKQDKAIREELRDEKICKVSNVTERIIILKEEAEKRYGRENYYYALIDIETMLNAPCTFEENEESIKEYKELLCKALDNIENNLQQMEFEQIPSLNIIDPDYWPAEISYDLEKTYEAIRNDGWYRSMLPYHLKRVLLYLKRIQRIEPELSSDELLLLVNAGLYFAAEE